MILSQCYVPDIETIRNSCRKYIQARDIVLENMSYVVLHPISRTQDG